MAMIQKLRWIKRRFLSGTFLASRKFFGGFMDTAIKIRFSS